MSEEIIDESEVTPWTGSGFGGPQYATDVPISGSTGEYLLVPQVKTLLQTVYPRVSNDINEELKILKILKRGIYNEEEREFLEKKIEIHLTQYQDWLQSLDE